MSKEKHKFIENSEVTFQLKKDFLKNDIVKVVFSDGSETTMTPKRFNEIFEVAVIEKELMDVVEGKYPTDLRKQFELVRKYTAGPVFDAFCKLKGISGDYKKTLEIIFSQ